MFRRPLLLLGTLAAVLCCGAIPSRAQIATVVASCPASISPVYGIGSQHLLMQDTSGNLCTASSAGSVTVAGFTPGGTYASLTATASSARVALPAGTVVVAYNTGTTAVSCKLGDGTVVATANMDQIAPGGFFSYTVGSNVDLACIDQSGSASNVVVLSGGAGVATGSGGGGGASAGTTSNAGSAVATSSTNTASVVYNYGFNGTTWDQLQVDASKNLKVIDANSAALLTAAQAAIPAGSAIIGKMGIDQTTPGTTNGVALVGVNGATALAGNGTTGTGSPRVTIASDNTAFSVNSQPTPVTSGGLTVYTVQPAASDNHANIKNGAGQVYGLHMFNNSATINYVRLYNAASGFNGCNSATNLIWSGHIPASTSDAGFVVDIANGIAFSTGISICVTGTYGQTSTANATASAIDLNVLYK